jgi:hypothetical protein
LVSSIENSASAISVYSSLEINGHFRAKSRQIYIMLKTDGSLKDSISYKLCMFDSSGGRLCYMIC